MGSMSQKTTVRGLLIRPVPPGIKSLGENAEMRDGRSTEFSYKGFRFIIVEDREVYVHRLRTDDDIRQVQWEFIPGDDADRYEVWNDNQYHAKRLDNLGK